MWPFSRKKSLEDVLNTTKKVKIEGLVFRIRKINPMDHLSGSKTLLQIYDTYEGKRENKQAVSDGHIKKIHDHYKDVILAAVVEPKLSRKKEPDTIEISQLMKCWDVVEPLYDHIIEYTYGKKKLRHAMRLQKLRQSN